MTYFLFGFDADIINDIIKNKNTEKLIIFDENEDNTARLLFESFYTKYKNMTLYEGDILLVFNNFLRHHPEEQNAHYKISDKNKKIFDLENF
jgi:hypothetical protein